LNWWFELFERKGLVLFFLICLIISVYAKPLKFDEIDWFSESVGDLKISTDAKTYYGVSSAEVLVKVENLQGVDKLTDLAVLFEDKWAGNPDVKVESISVLQENVPYQVPVSHCETLSCSYAFDENTDLNGFVSRFYYCKNSKTPCEFDEKTDTCTYRQCVTVQETRYRDEWQAINLTEPKNLSSKVNYKEWKGKKFHAKKGINYFKKIKPFKKNQTIYLKIKIKFPPNSQGEFAIATENSFLDPWWNSNYSYRKKIVFSDFNNAGTDVNNITLFFDLNADNIDFSHINSSGRGFAFVDADDATDLNFYVEDFDYANQHIKVWVRVPEISSNTDFIYFYYDPTNDTNNENRSGTFSEKYKAVWLQNEGSGTAMHDLSDTADATLNNGDNWSSSGKHNGAYLFDGTDDYANAGTTSTYNFLQNTANFTIVHWLKKTAINSGTQEGILETNGTSSSEKGVWYNWRDLAGGVNTLYFALSNGSSNFVEITGSDNLVNDTAWHFVTITGNGTNVKLYNNTVVDKTVAVGTLSSGDASNVLTIGAYGSGSGTFLDGMIDSFRILNVPLNQDEINVLYLAETGRLATFGSEENAPPSIKIDVNVNSPNGGEVWSGSQVIDFNVLFSENADLNARIAFSSVQGGFENDINTVVTLNDYASLSFLDCDDSNFQDSTNCRFYWNTWTALSSAPDGSYFIDINVFSDYNSASDSSDASFSLNNSPQFDANFVYSVNGALDKENGVNTVTIDLNGQEWYKNVHPIAYQYDENNAVIGTSKNLTYVDGNEGDRLFKLTVTYQYDYNSDTFTDTNTNLIRIPEYPQGLDFNHSTATVNSVVDFNAFVVRPSYVKSWYWDFNDGGNAGGQNVQHPFSSTGDFNVCVEVQNIFDLNRKKCNIVPVGGKITFNFRNEDPDLPISPMVVFDGNSYNPSATGVLTIPLVGFATKTYEMTAYDNNHPTRHYLFDLNQYADLNLIIALQDNTNGLSIPFKFYDVDEETILSNALIEIRFSDGRIVEINKTNASGEVTFYLDQRVPDYKFFITRSNGSKLKYGRSSVVVEIPKNEITLANVTPFDIVVSVLKNTILQDKTTPQEVYVFSNTVSYYQFLIDADGYLSRKYHLQLKGDENSLVLTPYLVDDGNGASMTLKTVNYVTNKRIPGVEVKIYRNFENAGKVLVEQVVTDAKGEALVSGLPNYSYEYEVYYNGKLVDVQDITVTSTTIVISFNPAQTTAVLPIGTASVNFYPQGGLLDENTWIITQTISIDANAPSVDKVLIYATETDANKQTSDVNLYVKTINSVGVGTTVFNSIDLNSDLTPAWDNNNNLVITVVIVYSDGSSYAWQQVYVKKIGTQALNVWSILTSNMFAIVGCDEGKPCGILILIAVFFTIFIIAALVTTTPLRNPAHVTLVSIIPIIFFTVLGWLPIFWSVMYSVFVIVGLFAFGRVRT